MILCFRSYLLTLLCVAFLAPAHADRVLLQSGEEVEGRIIRETDTEVVLEIPVTENIFDERRVPVENIAEIHRTPPDQAAFEEIRSYLVSSDYSMPVETYREIIRQRLDPFLEAFPDSGYADSVQRARDEFQAAMERVQQGDVKIQGEWYSREEFEANRYQLTARILHANFEAEYSGGNYLAAMNTFDRLQSHFRGSEVYPSSVEAARELLPALKENLERLQRRFEAANEQRERQLQLASDKTKQELMEAVETERERVEAAMAAADETGPRWIPPSRYSEESMERLFKMIEGEIKQLVELDLATIRQSVELSNEAWMLARLEHFNQAGEMAVEAREVWEDNQAAEHLLVHLEQVRERLAQRAAMEAEEQAAGEEETAKEEDVELDEEKLSQESEEVDESPLEEVEEGRESEAGLDTPIEVVEEYTTADVPTETPETPVDPSGDVGTVADGVREGEAQATPGQEKIAMVVEDEDWAEPVEAESDPHFFMTIPGALTVVAVVVILGGLFSLLSHLRPKAKHPEAASHGN